MEIRAYYVTSHDASMWLADDEHTWTTRLCDAAEFASFSIAEEIRQREDGGYVMAWIA